MLLENSPLTGHNPIIIYFRNFKTSSFSYDSSIVLENFKVDMTPTFLFSYMKVHKNQVDKLTSYLVPEVSMLKAPKHDTQNWFTETTTMVKIMTSSGLNAYPLKYKINYNSTIAESNLLKLCEQKVARII